jgi:stearoyl-CoA desaturase (delta-9 desaturase)
MTSRATVKKKLMNIIKGNNSLVLQLVTISIMALAIVSPLLISFSWSYFALFVFMYVMSMGVGVSITYHRYLTHKAINMHPIMAIVGKFFGSMSGTGSPIMWVMTHRMHHRHSDKPLDPHPPGKVGITVFGKYPKVDLIGIGPIARDNVNRYIHKYYFLILALYGLCWYLAGIELFYYAFVFPILGSIFASNAVNWYGHTRSIFGYRNYETKDKSANHAIAGLLVLGEGWHNNHHRYPNSANFGFKSWEFDPSWKIIQLLNKLGLVTDIKLPGRQV